MNLLLALALFTGVDLYFLKDSPNLLARVVPYEQVDVITLYYSFSAQKWDSVIVKKEGRFFDAVITPSETLNIVGIYVIYANGVVDDNKGTLYLYEVKMSPKMLMPFTIDDLQKFVNQARKKIVSGIYIDEAITLLDYVDNILTKLPTIKNSPLEIKKNILQSEIGNLRNQMVK